MTAFRPIPPCAAQDAPRGATGGALAGGLDYAEDAEPAASGNQSRVADVQQEHFELQHVGGERALPWFGSRTRLGFHEGDQRLPILRLRDAA